MAKRAKTARQGAQSGRGQSTMKAQSVKAQPARKRPAMARAGDDAAAGAIGEEAIALLTADHRRAEELFEKYAAATEAGEKAELARLVCTELAVHTMIEEEIFYPACRAKGVADAALDEAQVEHDGAKVLINDLASQDARRDPYYDAKIKVLQEYIKHHVAEEERPGDGIFAKACAAGVELGQLAQRLQERKTELMEEAESPSFEPSAVRSIDVRVRASGRPGHYQAPDEYEHHDRGQRLPAQRDPGQRSSQRNGERDRGQREFGQRGEGASPNRRYPDFRSDNGWGRGAHADEYGGPRRGR